jgi:hypothetical protein
VSSFADENKKLCVKCSLGCSECSSVDDCKDCSVGFQEIGFRCMACPKNCEECAKGKCTVCKGELLLKDG